MRKLRNIALAVALVTAGTALAQTTASTRKSVLRILFIVVSNFRVMPRLDAGLVAMSVQSY